LALVTANDNKPRNVTYDLRALTEDANPVRAWTTDPTSAHHYTRTPDTHLQDGRLTVTHAPNTVTTLEIEDVQTP
jgi:hypothetical protein